MQQIHHKRNEILEVEFFEDAKHTVPFDFTGKKNLYILPKDGDITPLCKLHHLISDSVDVKICVTGISYQNLIIFANFVAGVNELNNQAYGIHESEVQYYFLGIAEYAEFEKTYKFDNFHNITPNLSKYILEDNAVLFLSGEKISLIDYDNYYNMFSGYRDIEFEGRTIKGMPYHPQIYGIHTIGYRISVHKHEHGIDDYTNFSLNILKGKKLTIFLPHGTQSEIQKANEIEKELKEKYGVEEVNLFALHCFIKSKKIKNDMLVNEVITKNKMYFTSKLSFNKIITTNSTGILKPEDSSERLQVFDCKEIFEEDLKRNN